MDSENMSWRTARGCEGGACIEVADGEDIRVRDTQDRDGFTLDVTAQAWAAFTEALKGGAA